MPGSDTLVHEQIEDEFSETMFIIRFKFQELESDGTASLRTDHGRIDLDFRLTLWRLQHDFHERPPWERRSGLNGTASHGYIGNESVDRRLVHGNGCWKFATNRRTGGDRTPVWHVWRRTGWL